MSGPAKSFGPKPPASTTKRPGTALPSAGNAKKAYVPLSDKLVGALTNISDTIADNKDTIDTVQELGINLTRTISSLSITAVKYAKIVDNFLDTVEPILTKLPILPKNVMDLIKKIHNTANQIIATCDSSKVLAADVESGLMSGDLAKLKTKAPELQVLTKKILDILPD
jgi:hypothetical protein